MRSDAYVLLYMMYRSILEPRCLIMTKM